MSNDMKIDISAKNLAYRVASNGGFYVMPLEFGNAQIKSKLSEVYGIETQKVEGFLLLMPAGVSEKRKREVRDLAVKTYSFDGEIKNKQEYFYPAVSSR